MSDEGPSSRPPAAPFAEITPKLYRRADELVDQLLDASPPLVGAERDAWLLRETGADAVLRAQVERLLHEHEREDGVLDTSLARGVVEAGSLESSNLIGRRLGNFRVLEALGAGGMGEVYLAEDERLGRRVALKLLPPDLVSHPSSIRRFRREARLLSSLDHPAILTVYELVEDGGVTCLATELVAGETLRDRLARGPLPWPEAVEITRQVAEALAAAHAAGVVHCDVKPENVMLRRDERVKVLDFGVARLMRRPGDEAAGSWMSGDGSSRAGIVFGTPLYMSPEQIRGQEVDGRSDLFSLGVMLFELLTGERPFAEGSLTETISAILERPAPSPAERGVALPADLEGVLRRLLRKEREHRYRDAAAAARDLQRVARHEQLPATAEVDRVPRPWRRRLAVSTAVALPVLATVAWLATRDTGPPPVGEPGMLLLAAFDNTTGEAVFDRTLWRALAVALEQSPNLALLPEDVVQRTLRAMEHPPNEKVVGEVARAICERHGIPLVVGGSISALGESYVVSLEAMDVASGEVIARELVQAPAREAVLDALARSARSLRARLGETRASIARHDLPVAFAHTSSLEAWRFFALARDRLVVGAHAEAVPLLEQAIALDPAFAQAHADLGRAFLNMGDDATGQVHTERAFGLRAGAGERERLHIEQQYYRSVVGDLDRSLEVLELWRAAYPHDYVPLSNIALHHSLTGDHERGLEAARDATRLVSGDVVPYVNEAGLLTALGRFAEARATLERAASLGLVSVNLRQNLAVVAWLQGDPTLLAKLREEVAGTSGEPRLLSVHAALAAAGGRRRLEEELVERALELAADQPGLAGRFGFEAAMRAAAYGDCARSITLADRTLALTDERWFTSGIAIALALCGEAERAERLIEGLVDRYPHELLIATEARPVTLAVNALYGGDPEAALELLRTASRYEQGTYAALWPVYVRGLAHLQKGEPEASAREFARVAASAGILAIAHFAPPRALALLGLARAEAMSGDYPAARAAYQQVFEEWRDADLGLPALAAAREELERVGSLPRSEPNALQEAGRN